MTSWPRDSPYESIERAGGRLIAGFSSLLENRGVQGIVQGVPGSFNVHLGRGPANRGTVGHAGRGQRARACGSSMALLERGDPRDPGRALVSSLRRTPTTLVDETLNAFEDALDAI